MTLYAVKHVPSGNYLPQLGRRRGFTFLDPQPMSAAVPRLHRTRRQAKLALHYWLRGVWKEEVVTDYFSSQAEYCGNYPVKKPERRAEDMEIVPFEIVEARPLP